MVGLRAPGPSTTRLHLLPTGAPAFVPLESGAPGPFCPLFWRHDIIRDIVNQRKLRGITRRIKGMYGSPQKCRRLEAVAALLGRKRVKHGAYAWESTVFARLPPVSIPHHSKELKRFTAESILDHLMQFDVPAWEATLPSEDESE